MKSVANKLIQAALDANTPQQARRVQALIEEQFGARHIRPVGDKWNNHGLMGAAGSFDLKLIEAVTNMQDAIVERYALRRWGSRDDVPYDSPHAAATDLLADIPDLAKQATIVFKEATESTDRNDQSRITKVLTAVFSDRGCGLVPEAVPGTIFGLGGSNKEDALYLQGAFGMGGALTYRNAECVVLVTRRDPELLAKGEEDRITVAVVEWRVNTKGRTAFYLVDNKWEEPGDTALPWSCKASEYPEFGPGTHIALIAYRVEGYHAATRGGDQKGFDTAVDTRLFNPVMPVWFVNELVNAERGNTLRGLENRLENSEYNRALWPSDEQTLPYRYDGTTYLLPMHYTLLAPAREPGGIDKFVAKDHTVIFTSNGQVHHHWTPAEFLSKTGLNKIHNRVLVVVETDELPILLRTSLFTADRNDLVRGDAALRLEEDVAASISSWDSLREENNALLRESLKGSDDGSTLAIANRISRAINAKGFGVGGGDGTSGGKGGKGSGGGGGKRKPVVVRPDPTTIDGPDHARAEIGKTRSLTYTIDAEDSFFDRRGEVKVTCDHPSIRPGREITVGKGRNGRVQVLVAVPELDPGTHELTVILEDWMRVSGGFGPRLEHTTKLELVNEIEGKGSGTGKPGSGTGGDKGIRSGPTVAFRWRTPADELEWEKITVGEIQEVPASILAERPEYADLAKLGDQAIPTVLLNEEYPPFKKYLEGRNKRLTKVERPREQYAAGVGVALLTLQEEIDSRSKTGGPVPDQELVASAQRAAAKAVLAVMPAFDDLAREAGLD
ncbi:hypothetical protein I550_2097 [Mycobacterium intracellulare 1956]|uniref:Histidine kinase-, DNA gyrase B-, and HSP90-like ATPase family protein n=1 Tax=Mycobacterium intracellulare 1956 TaxID=1299331 RepID=X8CRC9_MYCIT|nr:hypothetical protein I550_2097 [Mycobacterium intracellulare 1956]